MLMHMSDCSHHTACLIHRQCSSIADDCWYLLIFFIYLFVWEPCHYYGSQQNDSINYQYHDEDNIVLLELSIVAAVVNRAFFEVLAHNSRCAGTGPVRLWALCTAFDFVFLASRIWAIAAGGRSAFVTFYTEAAVYARRACLVVWYWAALQWSAMATEAG